MLSSEEKQNFRGVTCRCYHPEMHRAIGKKFPGNYVDLLGLEASFKENYRFEMWGMNRTSVMKEYPFPNIKGGQATGLTFYPETIIWHHG